MPSFLSFLHRVSNGEDLTAADAERAMTLVLEGEVSTPRLTAFLVALKMKCETAEELLGFARAMRGKSAHVTVDAPAEEPLVDTCGTGGDSSFTFNISTVAAFVVAGAGLRIAKHGNRSISSRCGSADILESLGVNISLPPEQIAQCITETGIGFLFAPALHPAMRYAQPARLELKMRTVFNLLGPLTNPAGATVQVVGAPTAAAAGLMARALALLGLHRGFVVHGSDGLDEITTTGETLLIEVAKGEVIQRTVTPEDFGVAPASAADLTGGDLPQNCAIATGVLAGEPGPARNIVLVNASAALVAAGRTETFRDGVQLAARAIDSGAARAKLAQLVEFSRRVAQSPHGSQR